jgi:hypothetical protein
LALKNMIPNITDMKKYTITGSLSDSIPLPFDIKPEEYLKFAKTDISSPYRRNRINALSNAKRGLHLQVGLLADALGLNKLPKKERLFFPQKLNFISLCGLVAPKILKKINSLRNTVEHDYVVPEIDAVHDFIDVVELFIRSSISFRNSFPYQLHFGLKHSIKTHTLPQSMAIGLFPGNAELRFIDYYTGRRDSLKNIGIIKSFDDSELKTSQTISISSGRIYYDWLSYIISKI